MRPGVRTVCLRRAHAACAHTLAAADAVQRDAGEQLLGAVVPHERHGELDQERGRDAGQGEAVGKGGPLCVGGGVGGCLLVVCVWVVGWGRRWLLVVWWWCGQGGAGCGGGWWMLQLALMRHHVSFPCSALLDAFPVTVCWLMWPGLAEHTYVQVSQRLCCVATATHSRSPSTCLASPP